MQVASIDAKSPTHVPPVQAPPLQHGSPGMPHPLQMGAALGALTSEHAKYEPLQVLPAQHGCPG
jgi:hypothetical protein